MIFTNSPISFLSETDTIPHFSSYFFPPDLDVKKQVFVITLSFSSFLLLLLLFFIAINLPLNKWWIFNA